MTPKLHNCFQSLHQPPSLSLKYLSLANSLERSVKIITWKQLCKNIFFMEAFTKVIISCFYLHFATYKDNLVGGFPESRQSGSTTLFATSLSHVLVLKRSKRHVSFKIWLNKLVHQRYFWPLDSCLLSVNYLTGDMARRTIWTDSMLSNNWSKRGPILHFCVQGCSGWVVFERYSISFCGLPFEMWEDKAPCLK